MALLGHYSTGGDYYWGWGLLPTSRQVTFKTLQYWLASFLTLRTPKDELHTGPSYDKILSQEQAIIF